MRRADVFDAYGASPPAPARPEPRPWGRVRHHLREQGRDAESDGRELLVPFARNAEEAAMHLREFRDAGGTHGCVSSMNKGLGGNINAHIDYVATAKQLIDAG